MELFAFPELEDLSKWKKTRTFGRLQVRDLDFKIYLELNLDAIVKTVASFCDLEDISVSFRRDVATMKVIR